MKQSMKQTKTDFIKQLFLKFTAKSQQNFIISFQLLLLADQIQSF